jgi:hypothetical protein
MHIEYMRRIEKLAGKFEITERHIYDSAIFRDVDSQFKIVNEQFRAQKAQFKSLSEKYEALKTEK